ncbi:RNA methyltransferase [bacterium 210820-DFI.6.37]|nr:RNA methyltransferase [bacterium 210820-DFI.6.37]
MKQITSKDNRLYKQCGRLAARKYRDLYGQYLIEGEKVIRDAIATGQKLVMVIARPDYGLRPDSFPCPCAVADGKLFSQLAQTTTSQGILAVVEKKEMTREAFCGEIRKGSGNVVLLDRLQDPGNIGTIIRTADAAGYSGVMAMKGTADLFSPKIVRAAAGSLFRVPVFYAETPEEAVSVLEETGKNILATGFDTELYYYDVDMKQNTGLIIGNEGNGISDELMKLAHKIIKIPMAGDIDSLNAAVAAGVLMYESVRK